MLMVVLVWLVLMVFLAVWTAWFQAYIYSQPVAGLIWRAPAAGSAVALVLVIWCWLDYGPPPGKYPALFYSPAEETEPYKELWGVKGGRKTLYKREKDAAGRYEYRDNAKKPLPSHLDGIIVKEDGEEVLFKPELDDQGKFKIERGQYLRYIDPNGRVMSEAAMGQLSAARWGLIIGNLVLNFVHLLVWVACLWLLLEFQWWHAVGQAVVCWLVMSLFIMPMVLGKVEDEARKQRAPETLTVPSVASGSPTSPLAWKNQLVHRVIFSTRTPALARTDPRTRYRRV
jgi:hypothetical protein